MTKSGFVLFYAVITYAFFIVSLVVFPKNYDVARSISVGELIGVVGTFLWASIAMVVDYIRKLERKTQKQEVELSRLMEMNNRVQTLEKKIKELTLKE